MLHENDVVTAEPHRDLPSVVLVAVARMVVVDADDVAAVGLVAFYCET